MQVNICSFNNMVENVTSRWYAKFQQTGVCINRRLKSVNLGYYRKKVREEI